MPQTIKLRSYLRFARPGHFTKTVHPILCGTTTRGVIDVLPDHPHEGEVKVPAVLTDTLSLGGYAAREYPDFAGAPIAPEVIAQAHILEAITDANSFKHEVDSKDFGVIGAYNGHRVQVGRVVTDSTWHHWFDVNLTGRPSPLNEEDPRKLNGFNDTLAGQRVLAKIQNYFRNVAIWLAPPLQQRQMILTALYRAVASYPLIEEADASLGALELGKLGSDALARLYGACAVTWWLPILVPKFPAPELVIPRPQPEPGPLFEAGLTMREVEEALLGGVFIRLVALRDEVARSKEPPRLEAIEQGVVAGLRIGLDELLKQRQRSHGAGKIERLAELLER